MIAAAYDALITVCCAAPTQKMKPACRPSANRKRGRRVLSFQYGALSFLSSIVRSSHAGDGACQDDDGITGTLPVELTIVVRHTRLIARESSPRSNLGGLTTRGTKRTAPKC